MFERPEPACQKVKASGQPSLNRLSVSGRAMREVKLPRQLIGVTVQFALAQRRQHVGRKTDRLAMSLRQPLTHQPVAPGGERCSRFRAEAGVAKLQAILANQHMIKPGRGLRPDHFLERDRCAKRHRERQRYPAIGQSWRRAWPEVIPFFFLSRRGQADRLYDQFDPSPQFQAPPCRRPILSRHCIWTGGYPNAGRCRSGATNWRRPVSNRSPLSSQILLSCYEQ